MQVMHEIGSIASNDIKIRSSHPISEDWEARGLKGLQMKLALDHHSEAFIFEEPTHSQGSVKIPLPFVEMKDGVKFWLGGSMRPIRTVLTAANEVDDSVFCLVECEERLHESKEEMGLPNEKRWDHKAYSIVKFDILLDDTSRIVTGITEMRQLGLAEMTSIAKSPTEKDSLTPSAKISTSFDSDEEERKKEFARNATLHMPCTWDFPTSHLRRTSATNEVRKVPTMVLIIY